MKHRLPKSAGLIHVDIADGEALDPHGRPVEDWRAVDVYEAREWAIERKEELNDEADTPDAGLMAHAQPLTAEWFEQPEADWPPPRAAAFWDLVFDEVARVKKPVGA